MQTCRQYLAGEQIGLLGAGLPPGKPCPADVQNQPYVRELKLWQGYGGSCQIE